MVIVTPLTLKGTRSMIAMQQLQPELKKLQVKYKDDRQKLNEEMMKFYKEHNINPVGGCLPLLVQMPVFIVLYRVLHGLTQLRPYGEDMGVAIGPGGPQPRRRRVLRELGTFDPQYLDHSTRPLPGPGGAPGRWSRSGSTWPTSFTRQLDQGIVARPPLPGPDRAHRRHRLVPAAPDPGPQPGSSRRSTPSSRC